MDADPAGTRHAKVGIARIERDIALMVEPVQRADRRAVGEYLRDQTQRIEHGEPARLDHQARPDGARFLEPFEQGDAVALPVEQQRGGQPRRTASGNRDVEPGHRRSNAASARRRQAMKREMVGDDRLELPTSSV